MAVVVIHDPRQALYTYLQYREAENAVSFIDGHVLFFCLNILQTNLIKGILRQLVSRTLSSNIQKVHAYLMI